MPTNGNFQDVSNCYVFKSRLQELAQKLGLPTPVYQTIKEGPSHEPIFRSTVVVNDVRYDSLLGFFNRKAAEQSAAEVALVELSQSADVAGSITHHVHETGLCKNLLQEYAQKMNYAIPVYECRKNDSHGRAMLFSCTVDIGGIKYIGAATSTKKEAEIKAARTALFAIQANASFNSNGNSAYTVVPSKKKVVDSGTNSQETSAALKPKKKRFKNKFWKKKHTEKGGNHDKSHSSGGLEVHMHDQAGPGAGGTDSTVTHVTGLGVSSEGAHSFSLGCNLENTETAFLPGDENVKTVTNSLNADIGLNTLAKERNVLPGVVPETSTCE